MIIKGYTVKNFEKEIAKAIRIEYSEHDDKLFIVFEITDTAYKQNILKDWTKDIEFIIKDKNLIKEE